MSKRQAHAPDDPYVELIVLVCDLALDIALLTELPVEKRDALFSFAMQIQKKAVALNKARIAPKLKHDNRPGGSGKRATRVYSALARLAHNPPNREVNHG